MSTVYRPGNAGATVRLLVAGTCENRRDAELERLSRTPAAHADIWEACGDAEPQKQREQTLLGILDL